MKTKLIVVTICVLVMGFSALLLFHPVPSVQAAPDGAPSAQKTPNPWQETLVPVRETLQALPTQEPADLEALLKREQLTLSNQQVRLTLAHTIADAAQTFIDSQKAKGKDTAALEKALERCNQQIKLAESEHAQAAGLLTNPAGFDASGHVTDRAAARQTIRDAGQSLRESQRALSEATLALRKAMRAYRGK